MQSNIPVYSDTDSGTSFVMGRVDSCLVILGLSLGLLEAQNPGPGSATTPALVSVRDPALYPVCVSDSDCDKISEKGGLTYFETKRVLTSVVINSQI